MDDPVGVTRSDGLDNRLASLLYRFDCPTAMELGEFYLGMVGDPRRSAIARHLETCPRCTVEYAALRSFMLQPDPELQVAPPPAEQPGVLEKLKWLVAVLVAPPNLAPAYRGTDSPVRNYRAGDYDISLVVRDDPARPGRKQIDGLVMGLEENMLVAGLAPAGAAQTQADFPVDEFGNFSIPDVSPGLFDLIISRADGALHIRLPNFEVLP